MCIYIYINTIRVQITFADEKPFYYGAYHNPKNTLYYRNKSCKDNIPEFPKRKSCAVVNVFCAINYHMKSELHFIHFT